jgi:hypothetical protein
LAPSPSAAVFPGAAEKTNSVFSASPMRPKPGLATAFTSLASGLAERPPPALSPNGSSRQASSTINTAGATAIAAWRTSSSGSEVCFSLSSEEASASTGSSRFSPDISTPWPAK